MTKLRPKVVHDWMRVSRRWADQDIVLGDFGVKWWKWWTALQPPSRVQEDNPEMIPPTYLMNWEGIHKPGKDGLILVILTLRWWGVASSTSDEWKKAVDDVSSAIFCMADGGLMDIDSTGESNGQGLSKRAKGAVLTSSSAVNSRKRKANADAVSKGGSGPHKKQLLSRYFTPFWV